jgi:hypothetical protein
MSRIETPSDVLWKGIIQGTPRTYGDRRSEDIWRCAIIDGQWEGSGAISTLQIPLHLDFQFRVNPHSPRYNRNVSSNGPDLDTMVIGALGGLLHCRNPELPTLRLIQQGGLCQVVRASKSIVDSDEQAGFTLHVRAGEVLSFEVPQCDTSLMFCVSRHNLKVHRRRAVQQAAEHANKSGFRAPRGKMLEIRLAFAEDVTRNPLSADWLEAVIDGLGASRVGCERFFDGPPSSEFGYDDSVVYRLDCARVRDLPHDIGLHVCCTHLNSVTI